MEIFIIILLELVALVIVGYGITFLCWKFTNKKEGLNTVLRKLGEPIAFICLVIIVSTVIIMQIAALP